jgi:hypothetical protein
VYVRAGEQQLLEDTFPVRCWFPTGGAVGDQGQGCKMQVWGKQVALKKEPVPTRFATFPPLQIRRFLPTIRTVFYDPFNHNTSNILDISCLSTDALRVV